MKKVFLSTVLFFSLLSVSHNASAGVSVAWTCDLEADLQGLEVGWGLSVGFLSGEGTLECTSIHGDVTEKDIRVTSLSLGGGAGFGVVVNTKMLGINIGVADIDNLIGRFTLSASAGLTLVSMGIEPSFAVQASRGGLSVEFGFISKEVYGLGYFLRGNAITITEI